jgi:osmotically inducible lipoprotein OsmB
MKKLIALGVIIAPLAACNANSPTDRALAGGAIGAGAGALVGAAASGGRPGGVLAGAAIGGAGGAIVGAATTPSRPYYSERVSRRCRGYDAYGNYVSYRC